MACRLLLAVAVVACCLVGLSGATDHIVGANRGWNPNINYTLWSGNQTFIVGDLICKLLSFLQFYLLQLQTWTELHQIYVLCAATFNIHFLLTI